MKKYKEIGSHLHFVSGVWERLEYVEGKEPGNEFEICRREKRQIYQDLNGEGRGWCWCPNELQTERGISFIVDS